MSQYAPPLGGQDCLSGDVAQLGERLVRNEEVGGSIPLISTRIPARRRDAPGIFRVVLGGELAVPCIRNPL